MPLKTLAATSDHVQPKFCNEKPVTAGPYNNGFSFRKQPQQPIVIVMQKDQSTTDENGFYQSLHKHSAMHRIVLSRPFNQKIPLGSWVRLDLGVVNELGLSLKGDRALSCRLGLDAKVLQYAQPGEPQDGVAALSAPEDSDSCSSFSSRVSSRSSFDSCSSWGSSSMLSDSSAYSIETRPLQLDAWDIINNDGDTPAAASALAAASAAAIAATEADQQNPEVPGFFYSGKGGLEFRLSGHYQDTTKAKYFLYIAPTASNTHSVQAMPLTLGPIEVVRDTNEIGDGWSTDGGDRLNEMFRAYALNRLFSQSITLPPSPGAIALKDTYFLVKENWKMGTWGKAWDSALVLSDMFVRRIWRDPQCLDSCHIVDLSAGTGCVALLLGYVLGHLDPDYRTKLTLTDLEDALGLIRYNHQLNLGTNLEHDKNISIQRLRWGNPRDARAIYRKSGKPDIIFASDVLYEPECFQLLVRSLALLSEPGKTVVYLGYKRRGLKDQDESLFFDMAKKLFHVELVGNDVGSPVEYIAPVTWEKEHGFITRSAGGETDGLGWIDRLPDSSNKRSNGPGFGHVGQSDVQIFRMVRKFTSK